MENGATNHSEYTYSNAYLFRPKMPPFAKWHQVEARWWPINDKEIERERER